MLCKVSIFACLLLAVVGNCAGFKFSKCGGNGELDIEHIDVRPNVLPLPGNIYLDIKAQLKSRISNIDMNLELFRKTLGMDIKIPCLFNIGSCSYTDFCTILDRMESEDWGGIGAYIAKGAKKILQGTDMENCPYGPTVTNVNNLWLVTPQLPPLLAHLMSGQYKAKVQLYDHSSQELLSCFVIELEVAKGD